jgi:two-component system cell cycle sensor histidine kinase/response regulator CckA
MVRTLGYQGRSCRSGAAALQFLQEHAGTVRLVLTDLAMPRMDGGELAERIQDLIPSLPVALMARADDPHVIDLLGGYGDLPFLTKPVKLGALAELLALLIGAPPSATTTPPSMRRVVARRRSSGQHRIP